jgi:hypothetical protein
MIRGSDRKVQQKQLVSKCAVLAVVAIACKIPASLADYADVNKAASSDVNDVGKLLSENTHGAPGPSAVSESSPAVCYAPHLKLLPLWQHQGRRD